jgi:hypothetical protein
MRGDEVNDALEVLGGSERDGDVSGAVRLGGEPNLGVKETGEELPGRSVVRSRARWTGRDEVIRLELFGVSCKVFDLTDGEVIGEDEFEDVNLNLRVINGQKCTGMPHINVGFLEGELDGSREVDEAEVIGDGGTLLANTEAELLLGEAMLIDEGAVGKGDLDGVEVLSLDIFNKSHLHDVLLISRSDVGGDGGESGEVSSAEASLAGDDEVVTRLGLSKRNGLNDADSTDGSSQIVEGVGIEVGARLVRVGVDEIKGYFGDGSRAGGIGCIGLNKEVNAFTETST